MRIGGGALVNMHRCCAAPTTDDAPHRLTLARRCLGIAAWIVPGTVLALMPKCPACLAAYLAVGTGVGLSLSAAAYLQASLLILCIASLVYLAVRRLDRFAVVKEALSRAKSHRPTIQTKEIAPCKQPK